MKTNKRSKGLRRLIESTRMQRQEQIVVATYAIEKHMDKYDGYALSARRRITNALLMEKLGFIDTSKALY